MPILSKHPSKPNGLSISVEHYQKHGIVPYCPGRALSSKIMFSTIAMAMQLQHPNQQRTEGSHKQDSLSQNNNPTG
ncbi:hypothetical protein QQP08_014558 [Theobroma cacao]|nr:hypothetical protein QQP08_014558 [Theobroma cacao]